MRGVAEAAGMSLGSTYYYFPSKEHWVQAYYARSHEVHLAACEPILARESIDGMTLQADRNRMLASRD